MKKIPLALLLFASTAFAQREIFPSDYKPSPCAPENACESFTEVKFSSAAFKFLLRTLEVAWDDEHRDELTAMVQPYCIKRATCMATPGNIWWFCNDVFAQEIRSACDRKYPPKAQPHDNEQCHTWVDVYSAGVDQHPKTDWEAAQRCAKTTPATTVRKMEWWSVPPAIPIDYKGVIQVYTIDSETHVPVQADIRFEDQTIYTQDSPTGKPITYYQFKWPRKLVRTPNAQGHTDVVPTMMTMSAAGYEPVQMRVPTVVPKIVVSMSPSVDKLKRGRNTVTVTATDAATKKPVEAQVYVGDATAGFTNQPIEITVSRKRPEIWIRSPFDAYSDVVVVPAEK
ncbi:MAG TPA: hypothetical protein VGK31_13485 [Thermoanaerobaculia bacterium]|jgi:hypothetical protein